MLLLRVLTIVVFGIVLVSQPAPRVEAASCQFVLGFKTLHDLIPDIVGTCLVDEHHNPTNGDGLQETTGAAGGSGSGLLVWRKADNWTAYTDGYRTWVNGPVGLAQRLNSQRFFWEWNPDHLTIVPPPVAGDRCHTAGLSLAEGQPNGAAGSIIVPFIFTNNLTVSCTFLGFPGLQMLDALNNPLPTITDRGGQTTSMVVTVPPGGSAMFLIRYNHLPFGACYDPTWLKVTPPDEFDPLIVPFQAQVCGDGRIFVNFIGESG